MLFINKTFLAVENKENTLIENVLVIDALFQSTQLKQAVMLQ